MTNEEVFKEYSSEHWVLRENLCYLLQQYWYKINNNSEMPINPVGFVEDFLKDQSLINPIFAEQSKMNTLQDTIVAEVEDFKEL